MPVMELTQTQLTTPNKLIHNINEITPGTETAALSSYFILNRTDFTTNNYGHDISIKPVTTDHKG